MTLEERVKQLEASISDPDVRATTVVAFVRAALQAEALAAQMAKQEALAAHRRELAAERQRRHREELSRSERVTERDEALPTVTKRDERDSVPPAPPSPSGSLSLLPDPERAIPGLPAYPVVGKGPKEWSAGETMLAEHREAFPYLDVLGEYRKALAYVKANPQHRKTAKGMPTYLFRWLSRVQDRSGGRPGQVQPAAPKLQDAGKYLDQRDRCEFHREEGRDQQPAPEPVSWCRRCQKLAPKRAAGGAT